MSWDKLKGSVDQDIGLSDAEVRICCHCLQHDSALLQLEDLKNVLAIEPDTNNNFAYPDLAQWVARDTGKIHLRDGSKETTANCPENL